MWKDRGYHTMRKILNAQASVGCLEQSLLLNVVAVRYSELL